jgi:hypothetical protein
MKNRPCILKTSRQSPQLDSAKLSLSSQEKKVKLRVHLTHRVRMRAANTGALQKNSATAWTNGGNQHKALLRELPSLIVQVVLEHLRAVSYVYMLSFGVTGALPGSTGQPYRRLSMGSKHHADAAQSPAPRTK